VGEQVSLLFQLVRNTDDFKVQGKANRVIRLLAQASLSNYASSADHGDWLDLLVHAEEDEITA
jgi:hypothetical protein